MAILVIGGGCALCKEAFECEGGMGGKDGVVCGDIVSFKEEEVFSDEGSEVKGIEGFESEGSACHGYEVSGEEEDSDAVGFLFSVYLREYGFNFFEWIIGVLFEWE